MAQFPANDIISLVGSSPRYDLPKASVPICAWPSWSTPPSWAISRLPMARRQATRVCAPPSPKPTQSAPTTSSSRSAACPQDRDRRPKQLARNI